MSKYLYALFFYVVFSSKNFVDNSKAAYPTMSHVQEMPSCKDKAENAARRFIPVKKYKYISKNITEAFLQAAKD